MRVEQLRGPFNNGTTLFSKDYPGGGIVHVGVQVPYRTPARFIHVDIKEVENQSDFDPNNFSVGDVVKVKQDNGSYEYYKIFSASGHIEYKDSVVIDSIPYEKDIEIKKENNKKLFIKEINDNKITFGYVVATPYDGSDTESITYSFIEDVDLLIDGYEAKLYRNNDSYVLLLSHNIEDNKTEYKIFTTLNSVDKREITRTITPIDRSGETLYDSHLEEDDKTDAKIYYMFNGYDGEKQVIEEGNKKTSEDFILSKVKIFPYTVLSASDGKYCTNVVIKEDKNEQQEEYDTEFSFELVSSEEESNLVKDGDLYYPVKKQEYTAKIVDNSVSYGEYSEIDSGFDKLDTNKISWGKGSSYNIWNEEDDKQYPSLVLNKNGEKYNLSYAALEMENTSGKERFYKSLSDLPETFSNEQYKIALTLTANEASSKPYLTSLHDVDKDKISIGEDINISTITKDNRGPFYIIPTNGYTVGSTVKDYLKNDIYTQALLEWMNENQDKTLMDAPIVVVDKKYDSDLLGVAELTPGYKNTIEHLDTYNCFMVWHDVSGYNTAYDRGNGGYVVANINKNGVTGDKIFYNTTFDERKKLEEFLKNNNGYGKIKIVLVEANSKIINENNGNKETGYYTFSCSVLDDSSKEKPGFYVKYSENGKEQPIEGQTIKELREFNDSSKINAFCKELSDYNYISKNNNLYYINDVNSLQHSEIGNLYQYKRLKINDATICVFRLNPSISSDLDKELKIDTLIQDLGESAKNFFSNGDYICLCGKNQTEKRNYLNASGAKWYTVLAENDGTVSQEIYIRELNHWDEYKYVNDNNEDVIQRVECLLKVGLNDLDVVADIQPIEDSSILKSLKQEIENTDGDGFQWYEGNKFSVKILNHYQDVEKYLSELTENENSIVPKYIYVKELEIFYSTSIRRKYVFKPLSVPDSHPSCTFKPEEKDFHLWYVYDTSDPLLKNSLSLYLSNEDWQKYKNCKLVAKTGLNTNYQAGTTTISANAVEDLYKRMLAAYSLEKMNIITDYSGENPYVNYWLYNHSLADDKEEFKDSFTGEVDEYFSLVKEWNNNSKNDVVLIEENDEYYLYKKVSDKDSGYSYTKIYDFPTKNGSNELQKPYDSLVDSPIGYETYKDMISDIEWHKTLFSDKNGNYSKFFYVYADENLLKRGTYKLENKRYKLEQIIENNNPLRIRFSDKKSNLKLASNKNDSIIYVWFENDNSPELYYTSSDNTHINVSALIDIVSNIPVIKNNILTEKEIKEKISNEVNESFIVLKLPELPPKLFHIKKGSNKYIKNYSSGPVDIINLINSNDKVKAEDNDGSYLVVDNSLSIDTGDYIRSKNGIYIATDLENSVRYYVFEIDEENAKEYITDIKNSYDEALGIIKLDGSKDILYKGNSLKIKFNESKEWVNPYDNGVSKTQDGIVKEYTYNNNAVNFKEWDSTASKYESREANDNTMFSIKRQENQNYLAQSESGRKIEEISTIWTDNEINNKKNEINKNNFLSMIKNGDNVSLLSHDTTIVENKISEKTVEVKDYTPEDVVDILLKVDKSVSKTLNNNSGVSTKYIPIRISERNILEFENLEYSKITLTAQRDLPRETIIDIGYEKIQEENRVNVIEGDKTDGNDNGQTEGTVTNNPSNSNTSNMADISHWKFNW